MRLLTVEVKVETVAGIRMAKWTGAFDERMQVVVPDSMPAEAFTLLVKQYVKAGVAFAELVRCV